MELCVLTSSRIYLGFNPCSYRKDRSSFLYRTEANLYKFELHWLFLMKNRQFPPFSGQSFFRIGRAVVLGKVIVLQNILKLKEKHLP